MAIIRIARLWPGAERMTEAVAPAITPVDLNPATDSLDAFGSEASALTLVPPPSFRKAESAAQPPTVTDWSGIHRSLKIGAVAVLVLAAVGIAGWGYRQRARGAATGSLTIQTTPTALPVLIDGRAAGRTPLTVALSPATYAIKVGEGDQQRDLTVHVTAGSSVLQHLELSAAAAPAPVATTGALLVQTEPLGQMVAIDGVERGASPLTLAALAAGDHVVTVRGARGTIRRTIGVKAGETVSLLVTPVAPSTPAPGWLSVRSAARLELREEGKLLGTTETDQLMLAAGTHDIELVNDAIGYRARRQIDVRPGETAVVPVELPYASVNINAQPWAEVWMNGERVGETPIANLSKRVGTYEVVFKHPELGERRETMTVTLRQPSRLGVDMRSK
ncbi:MAG TPA: PEGA domain-containing protein [Vicinamibacterales bacterium]